MEDKIEDVSMWILGVAVVTAIYIFFFGLSVAAMITSFTTHTADRVLGTKTENRARNYFDGIFFLFGYVDGY